MPRAWVWIQVLSGWLPVWAIYAALIMVQHQPVGLGSAALIAARSILPAALLGMLVHRLARRVPWPRPFRLSFLLMHLTAAPLYALSWVVLASAMESLMRSQLVFAGGSAFLLPFLVLGIWLYAMVAGISYAVEATARAGRAEAAAARTQLAALRAQLHPHFLFNALHTVVQLIPSDPTRAADAAEQVAGLLRTTIEEDRDLVSLGDEWAFVSRYLEIERIRFGDRLRLQSAIDPALLNALVPSFSLQTLVENAVRHGAAPRVEVTDIVVTVSGTPAVLTVRVHDTGNGASSASSNGAGTGLARLHERLDVLYGGAARLLVESKSGEGFAVTMVIPRLVEEER